MRPRGRNLGRRRRDPWEGGGETSREGKERPDTAPLGRGRRHPREGETPGEGRPGRGRGDQTPREGEKGPPGRGDLGRRDPEGRPDPGEEKNGHPREGETSGEGRGGEGSPEGRTSGRTRGPAPNAHLDVPAAPRPGPSFPEGKTLSGFSASLSGRRGRPRGGDEVGHGEGPGGPQCSLERPTRLKGSRGPFKEAGRGFRPPPGGAVHAGSRRRRGACIRAAPGGAVHAGNWSPAGPA